MVKSIAILVLSILISSSAHLLLKKGVSNGDISSTKSVNLFSTAMDLVTNPWIVGGMFLHVCALVVWLWALSRVDISFAYPFLALGYVFVGIMAWWLLGESITATRLTGMLIIVFGLIVLSRGG